MKVIIVGGGTAGLVINKFIGSQVETSIVEKSGNRKLPWLYRIPLLIGLLYNKKNEYVHTSNIKYKNGFVPFFESGVIGGASEINGCVHVLGSEEIWVRILKKFGMTTNDLYSMADKLYTRVGESGKINLIEACRDSLDEAFILSAESLGVKAGASDLMNESVCGSIVNTLNRFLRSSVVNLNSNQNAKIIEGEVERLALNKDNEIIGVVVDGKVIRADKVILCAGVKGTNSILRRKALNIETLRYQDLELNSGKNIKDHVNIRINVEAKDGADFESLNVINYNLQNKIAMLISHFLGKKTLLRGTGATSSINLDIDRDGVVDTRINLLKFSENGRMGSAGEYFEKDKKGFSLSITQINPKSCGIISDNNNRITIDPGYLTNNLDVEHLKKAIGWCLNLLEQPSMTGYVAAIKNREEIQNDSESYIANNCYSGYHLIGGCGDIIDKSFKVKGYEHLYICDASILDEYPSSNIHSSVVLMAGLFSNQFKTKEL